LQIRHSHTVAFIVGIVGRVVEPIPVFIADVAGMVTPLLDVLEDIFVLAVVDVVKDPV
jgi:hypothetical protein